LTERAVHVIAVGAAGLSTGGGGDPYRGQLQLTRLLRQGKQVEVIPPKSLDDEALGCGTGGMGAPTIGLERLPAGDTLWRSVQALEAYLHTRFSFIAVSEIGGSNAIGPLITGAYSGLPVVDADPMGRAFPELQMNTFMIYGVSASPFGLADAHGNQVVFHVNDAVTAERLGRAVTIGMGGSGSLALPVITGKQLKEYAIHGTVSLCDRSGQGARTA